VTTAIEVIVEAIVKREIEQTEDEEAAKKFLNQTRIDFLR
jgi:hypothetical protein